MLDKQMLKTYRQRWQAVSKIERLEEQEGTVTQRWQQLNALLLMAKAIDAQPVPDDQEEAETRQRWNQLTTLYLSQSNKQSQ